MRLNQSWEAKIKHEKQTHDKCPKIKNAKKLKKNKKNTLQDNYFSWMAAAGWPPDD